MSDSRKVGSSIRQGIAPVLTMLIVLGLTLSGVPIGGRTGVAITEARVAAPEGGPGLAAAPKRARKGAERQHEQKQKDGKPKHHQQKNHKHKDHKQKGSDQQGPKEKEPTREQRKQDGTGQEGKRDRQTVRSQNQGEQQELTSGRLPAAETVAAASVAPLSAKDRYIVVLDDTTPNALSAARAIATDAPGVVPTHVYSHVFQGFAAVIPDQALAGVRRNPQVKAVVPDEVVHSAAHTVPTGINRIDADAEPDGEHRRRRRAGRRRRRRPRHRGLQQPSRRQCVGLGQLHRLAPTTPTTRGMAPTSAGRSAPSTTASASSAWPPAPGSGISACCGPIRPVARAG